jgi:putative oxidoreductase
MMKQTLFSSGTDWTGFVLRMTLGLILFPHGAQKMFGLFGGHGFGGTMDYFTGTLGLPWFIAFLVIVIEFFGAVALIIGFASRIWSAAIIVLMLGIIFFSHVDHGFFMNWFGNQEGEGFEYHLLMIGLAAGILLNGGGRYSLDRLITKHEQLTIHN